MGRGRIRAALLAMATMLIVGLSTGPVGAHTTLVGSLPSDGDVVPMSSDRLTLVFAEDLAPQVGQVSVAAPDGSGALVGPLRISGSTLEARLDLSVPGRHRVDFRVTAADGHPLEGSLSFRVRAAPVGAPVAPAVATPAAEAADRPVVTSTVVATAGEQDAEALPGGWWWALGAMLTVLAVIGLRRSAAVRSVPRRL